MIIHDLSYANYDIHARPLRLEMFDGHTEDWSRFYQQHKSLPRAWNDTVCNNVVPVCGRSRMRLRKIVLDMAIYFRREFGYDVVPWTTDEDALDTEHRPNAFLFYAEPSVGGIGVGATCFRWRESYWAMQWAWMHPYARNHGLLSAVWPFFRSIYGEFDMEKPLSKAMEGFLAKQSRLSSLSSQKLSDGGVP